MAEKQGMGGNTSNQQFREGTSVFDAGGQTVGVVKEYNPQGNYLLVQRGWAFSQDAYVPLNAIGDTGASGIYLKLDRGALAQQSWDQPPASGAAVGAVAPRPTAGGRPGSTMARDQATDIGLEASADKGMDLPVMGDQPATVEGRGSPPAHGAADTTEELREETAAPIIS